LVGWGQTVVKLVTGCPEGVFANYVSSGIKTA
jgi:hypothetical protein